MTTDDSTLQSRTIDMLRLPLMSLVVLIHMAQHYGPVSSFPAEVLCWKGIYDISYIFLTDVLPRVAIPGFFVISGYLFFLNFREWSWRKYAEKLKRRIHTLLIPYVIWNLIDIFLHMCNTFRLYGYTMGSVERIEKWYANRGIFSMFWSSEAMGSTHYDMLGFPYLSRTPVCIPLWFLRDLIVVTLFTPVIFWLLKKLPIPTFIVLYVALFTNVWIHLPGFSCSAMLYFSLGAIFAIYGRNIVKDLADFRLLSIISAVILMSVCVYLRGKSGDIVRVINMINVLFAIVAFFNAASWIAARGIVAPQLFPKGSFFVYVTHTLTIFYRWSPLSGAITIMSWVLPNSSIPCKLLQMLFVPIVSVSFCLTLYWILKRFLPRITAVLTGSR